MVSRNDYITKNAIDSRWFLAIKSIKSPLLLNSYFIPAVIHEQEREKVLRDSTYNPRFEYPNLDGGAIKKAITGLKNLRVELWQEEKDLSIREAYIEKIDQINLELQIMLSTVERSWDKFNALNFERYGSLNFALIDKEVKRIQSKYCIFNKVVAADINVLDVASGKTIDEASKIFANCPSVSGVLPYYSAEQVSVLWTNAISKFADGWEVVISEDYLHIKVSSRKRTVYIPKLLNVEKIKMEALFAHEIGVHVYRRELGKKTKFQLLSTGLAGYEMAEEGIALVLEQLIKNDLKKFVGFDKYLTLAYALGVVDGEKKDFQQTFTMLKKYYEMRLSIKHSAAEAKRIAEYRAWGNCVRVFRGGSTSVPGCCLLRDKIYREGNIYIWELLDKKPEFFKDVFVGKFDPGNSKHRELVNRFK